MYLASACTSVANWLSFFTPFYLPESFCAVLYMWTCLLYAFTAALFDCNPRGRCRVCCPCYWSTYSASLISFSDFFNRHSSTALDHPPDVPNLLFSSDFLTKLTYEFINNKIKYWPSNIPIFIVLAYCTGNMFRLILKSSSGPYTKNDVKKLRDG